MDDAHFDRIAAALGAAVTRRAGVIAAASAAFAAAADRSGGPVGARAGRRLQPEGPCGNGNRKDNICTKDSQCCTGICDTSLGDDNLDGRGRCRCVRRGGACKADKNCCGGRTCIDKVCVKPRPTPPPDPCASITVCASGCPHTTVQAAIDAAAAGATIVIGPGTWTESLTIGASLTLVGCGATVINAEQGRTITIVNSPTVEIRDLIVDGTGNGSPSGGGILSSGALTLSGATAVTNGYDTYGGCLRVLDPTGTVAMIDQSRLDSCRGGISGGGALLEQGSMTMSGSASIVNCSAPVAGGVGIVSGASLTMTGNSAIRSNTSTGPAGGVYVGQGSSFAIAAPATITGNVAASGGGGGGGGVFADSTNISIAPGTVTGNTPDNCYGVITC